MLAPEFCNEKKEIDDVYSQILERVIHRDFSDVLILAGAGMESIDYLLPSKTHALCMFIVLLKGHLITTNITDSFLLTVPDKDLSFVAVHSLLVDLVMKKDGKVQHRRLRSKVDQINGKISPEFKNIDFRGAMCPIPKTVTDNDVNLIEARNLGSREEVKTLFILGSSLNKATNARGLTWLENSIHIVKVIFVNNDMSWTVPRLRETLNGWGIKQHIEIVLICLAVDDFTDFVLESMEESDKHYIKSLIDPIIIRERRSYLEYPPDYLYSGEHTFGISGVSIKQIYQLYMEHVKKELSSII